MNPFGLLSSLGAALCWGTFFVPVRKVNVPNVWLLQGATGIGVLLFAIPVGFFWGFQILPSGLLSGVIWTASNIFALYSVRFIGLARTSPFLAGFSILVSFTWGTLFFEEKFNYFVLAITGIVLLLCGLPFVSKAEKGQLIRKKGYLFASAAGLIGGSYVVPMQATHSLQSGFFSSSLAIFAIGIPLLLYSRRWVRKEVIAGVMSGTLFNIGSLSVLVGITLVGITVAFPISQTATLFAVSWGILYFKEVIKRKSIIRVSVGAVLILSGAVLLSVA